MNYRQAKKISRVSTPSYALPTHVDARKALRWAMLAYETLRGMYQVVEEYDGKNRLELSEIDEMVENEGQAQIDDPRCDAKDEK